MRQRLPGFVVENQQPVGARSRYFNNRYICQGRMQQRPRKKLVGAAARGQNDRTNMATMLGYIATDAVLRTVLEHAYTRPMTELNAITGQRHINQ